MRRLHGISLNLYSSSRKGVEYNLCERCVCPQASESLLTLVQDFEWETLQRSRLVSSKPKEEQCRLLEISLLEKPEVKNIPSRF